MRKALTVFTRSIRAKLIGFIVVPILLFFVIGMVITISRINTASEQQLSKQVIVQAKNYAAILNSEFSSIMRQAQFNAGIFENIKDYTAQGTYSILYNSINNSELIYGAGVILEPTIEQESKQLSLRYIYKVEDSEKLYKEIILNNDYSLNYSDWYVKAKNAGEVVWTEPYYDNVLGNKLRVTVAVPFYHDEIIAGTSFIDIDLSQLQKHSSLETLTKEEFVIVSNAGRFITHPDPQLIMNKKLLELAEDLNDPDFVKFANNILDGKSGRDRVSRLSRELNEPFWIFYAPISSTGWSFATALPERTVFEFTHSQIKKGILGFTFIILFAILCVIIVANNLTRPLETLIKAVEKLGQGDLSINIDSINTHDEIGQLGNSFNQMTLQLRKHVEELKKQYAARDSVEHELQIARDIQSSLIPGKFPAFPEYEEFDLHAINVPASHVAGDFFDFFLLDSCRLFVVIADVSGKGIGPALLMAVSRTHIRNLANKGYGPAEILTELNQLLLQEREQPMFVTVFLAEYHIRDGSFRYANGGHTAPYLIHNDGAVSQFGDATGTIVGMLDDVEYLEETILLHKNETIVLYTDGILEARLLDGEFFGETQFITLLAANADMSPIELCDSAIAAVKTYQANKLSDDVTMLVLRRLI